MGGDCTVKKRAAVLVVMTGKKRAWNDETRLSQGATEQKQHTKGCACVWWVVWQERDKAAGSLRTQCLSSSD